MFILRVADVPLLPEILYVSSLNREISLKETSREGRKQQQQQQKQKHGLKASKNAVGLELLPNSDFGQFEILSVPGSANGDTSTGKAVLLQLTLRVPKSIRLKNVYLFFCLRKLLDSPIENYLTLHA